jgi:hypothetical protein
MSLCDTRGVLRAAGVLEFEKVVYVTHSISHRILHRLSTPSQTEEIRSHKPLGPERTSAAFLQGVSLWAIPLELLRLGPQAAACLSLIRRSYAVQGNDIRLV